MNLLRTDIEAQRMAEGSTTSSDLIDPGELPSLDSPSTMAHSSNPGRRSKPSSPKSGIVKHPSNASRWRQEPDSSAHNLDDTTSADPQSTGKLSAASSDVPLPPPLPRKFLTYADLVQHSGAPPRVNQQVGQSAPSSDRSQRKNSSNPLAIETCDVEELGESRSWLSSIVIHLVALLLIALMLAPVDFGGSERHELIMRLGNGESSGLNDGPEIDIEASEEQVVTVIDGDQPAKVDSSGGSGGGSKSQGDPGPRGTFFGIEASGHEFVYIVDMSGSMKGSRYRRAADELIRSIDGLQENQRFYVWLFSDSTVQMFGADEFVPTTIPATAANKRKLTNWVYDAFTGGSTDPRIALQYALRMNPSAIFMLSDGEFQKPRKNKKLFAEGTDAFTIVSNSIVKAPVHSIAFEDASSCENMKRLSVLSGGQYRFVGHENSELAKAELQSALDSLAIGDRQAAKGELFGLLGRFGHTEAAWKARVHLAKMLHEDALHDLQDDRMDLACTSLIAMMRIDPKGTVNADAQEALMLALAKRARDIGNADEKRLVMQALAHIRKTIQSAKIPANIAGVLARDEFSQAKEMVSTEPLTALKRLETLRDAFPKSQLENECLAVERTIVQDLLAKAKEIRLDQGIVPYVRALRSIEVATKNPVVSGQVGGELRKVVDDLRAASRAADRRGDSAAKAEVLQQMEEALGGHPGLEEMKRNSIRRDLYASKLLRTAMKLQRASNEKEAKRIFARLMKDYSDTPAAKIAKEQFERLQPDPDAKSLEALIRDEQP